MNLKTPDEIRTDLHKEENNKIEEVRQKLLNKIIAEATGFVRKNGKSKIDFTFENQYPSKDNTWIQEKMPTILKEKGWNVKILYCSDGTITLHITEL